MKAIILLSGGIDSTVTLSLALQRGVECIAISFDYRQRHRIELKSARAVCDYYGIDHHIFTLPEACFRKSALCNDTPMPIATTVDKIEDRGIPTTYVPARNTLFLAFALGQAEIHGAQEIHFGMNAADRNGYPDCRPEFAAAFQNLINVATKQSVEGDAPKLVTPLIDLDKAEIIKMGMKLGSPLELTHTCYDPIDGESPCYICDACLLREEGFKRLIKTTLT